MKRCSFPQWVVFGLVFSMFSVGANGKSPVETNQTQLVQADSDFCFRLIKELSTEQPHANLFVSPFSISSVLQMLSNGARGRTERELRQVLGLTGLDLADMNRAYSALARTIQSDRTNEVLSLANALWYRGGAELQPEFAAVNKEYYEAELGSLNFADPGSARIMNDWAAKSTHGKIKTIVQPPLPSQTGMIIANAIYFKGTWLNQFDPKQTQPRPFHMAGGGQKTVRMMQQTRAFQYQETPSFQAVQLPYEGDRLQMEVLLPETNSTVEALVASLNGQSWQATVLRGFQSSRGTLIMPRFKMRYGAELKKALTVLGLNHAWTPEADFSAMSSSPLFVSQVKHQSFVEVNEQGTEAAAVTTGIMSLASVRNQPLPFQMIVDRPFLFVISDRATQCILFVGAVYDAGSEPD